MSVRRHQKESVGNGGDTGDVPSLTSMGENRLEELYKLGQDQSLGAFKHEVVSHKIENDEEHADIGDVFHWGRRQYQKAMGNTQFTYVNAEDPSKKGGVHAHLLITWTKGSNHGQSLDYVRYEHNFPPFMVKKYNGGGSIDEYVSIKPLSVLVTMADGDACFKIEKQDDKVLSDCSKDKQVEEHMFRIKDIDDHFPDVKKYIMSAYSLYEKEHIKTRPKGMFHGDQKNANDPKFGPPGVPGGSTDHKW